MGIAVRSGLAGIALCALAACGGGGGGSRPVTGNPGGGTGTWTAGVFAPRADFAGQCISPRPGTSDRAGSAFTEKMFLRSWTNELYLWYNEVADADPNLTPDVIEYFETKLKTHQLTHRATPRIGSTSTSTPPNGSRCRSRVNRSATARSSCFSGDGLAPRDNVVAYVEPGTPAASAGECCAAWRS